MSLFGSLEQRSASYHPRDPALVEFWGGGPVSGSGVTVTAKRATGVMAVWAAMRLIAETLAELPLGIFRTLPGGGRERFTSHPLDPILHSAPNEWQTSLEWREMMQGHVLLRGNAYSRIVETRGGFVEQLIPLHPDRVAPRNEPLVPGGPRVRWYYYTPLDGPPEILLPGEVFHLRGLSDDGFVGLSPLEVAREALGVAIAAEQHAARFIANNVQPGGLLEHPGKLKEDAHKRLKQDIAERRAGSAHAGKTLILEEGMKWHQIGMTNRDAQFLEARKFQVTEIARMLKVPPHMIGDLERATFTNIEHQGIEFVKYTILPWAVRWEQRIAKDLLGPTERKTLFAKFNVAGLLRGDTQSRFAAYAIARQWGWLSADDIRELEDQNPLPDGQGKMYLSPLNMAPSDKLDELTDPKPEPAPATDPDADDEEDEDDERMRVLRQRVERAHVRLFLDAAQRIMFREINGAQRAVAQARKQQALAPITKWLEDNYDADHEALVARTLSPIFHAAADTLGGLAPALPVPDCDALAAAAARRHVSKQRAEARGTLRSGWKDGADALEALVKVWETRAQELAGLEVEALSASITKQLPAAV